MKLQSVISLLAVVALAACGGADDKHSFAPDTHVNVPTPKEAPADMNAGDNSAAEPIKTPSMAQEKAKAQALKVYRLSSNLMNRGSTSVVKMRSLPSSIGANTTVNGSDGGQAIISVSSEVSGENGLVLVYKIDFSQYQDSGVMIDGTVIHRVVATLDTHAGSDLRLGQVTLAGDAVTAVEGDITYQEGEQPAEELKFSLKITVGMSSGCHMEGSIIEDNQTFAFDHGSVCSLK